MAQEQARSSDSSPPDDDRRHAERHFVCAPARIGPGDGHQHLSMIKNVSLTGALLLLRTVPEVGEHVRLSLFLAGTSQEPRVVTGKVVRAKASSDPFALWSAEVAVSFDEELTDCADQIAALAESHSADD